MCGSIWIRREERGDVNPRGRSVAHVAHIVWRHIVLNASISIDSALRHDALNAMIDAQIRLNPLVLIRFAGPPSSVTWL